jgi:hypothetical protein
MNPIHRTALAAGALLGGLLCAAPAAAQTCSFSSGPDVIVGELTGPTNYSNQGTLEAFSMGTTSCNLGNTNLNWIASTPQHPAIGQNLYRLKDYGGWWAMEQVGLSWLKHGFAALQGNACCSNCQTGNSSHLGPGCSDPYSSSRNGTQSSLGPRWQVNANTGVFAYPPANPSWSGNTARRIEVEIADLESTASTTTRYYGEGHYVTPDDAQAGNNDNNVSYRQLTVSGSGSAWSFSLTGVTHRQSPAVQAWADSGVDPNVQIVPFNLPGEGHLVLGYSVTDLGNGTWHYEYALYNMNSDDSIGGFLVPVPDGVHLSNVGFHDVIYRNGDGQGNVNRDGTDWTFTPASGRVIWSTQPFLLNANANALRWGTTYNFRFDADTPPQAADVSLSRYKTGGTYAVTARAPSAPLLGVAFCDASDGALALCPCGNAGSPDSGCDLPQGTGGVHLEASSFSPDGMGGGTAVLEGTGFPPTTAPSVTLIRATTRETPPVVFGDGLRCVGTPIVRVTSGFASGGAVSLNVMHGAGPGTFAYQLWLRSQPAMFCTPEAYNLSNGYELTW